MKIPETLGATLSQNSRSSDQNSENPCKITPESQKACAKFHDIFGHFWDSDCFAQEIHQDFSKWSKSAHFRQILAPGKVLE